MRVPVGRMLTLLVWAYFSITLTAARAEAQISSLIDLGTLGGAFSDAVAINDAGQVVGVSETASGQLHGFLWHNGMMTDLGTLGGSFSAAVAINDAGQVVGVSQIASGQFHGFLWHNGVMTDLGTLGGSDTVAVAINASGQVVGRSVAADGHLHGFLWHNGVMTDLGTLGGSFSAAVALNKGGQVVGVSETANFELHGFLWQNGVMTDLGTPGGAFSEATAINAAGQVVGQSRTASGEDHAFLWQDGVMTDLGTLGGSFSAALALNEGGQVAGASQTASGQLHGFLWHNGMMTDLATLGGSFSDAVAINDKGQLVGVSETASGQLHGFLWHNGMMTDLGTLGGSFSDAAAVNDAGQVVGRSRIANGGQHAFLFRVADAMPPMTSAAPSPEPNANGWNKTDVTVTLSSLDNEGGSSVKEIVFSATGSQAIVSTTVPGASTSIILTNEGTTSLTYFARDNAGNQETARTLTMRLDKTVPVLNVPANVTENATSPSGALVAYSSSVSATDNLDTNPIISCNPPSGTTLPIGTSTVTCTATDAADNTVSRTFQVTVKGASEQIVDLIVKVAKISNRDPRIPDALKVALQRALDALIAPKSDPACHSLTPFVKVVQSQAGKKITLVEANELIADANRIRAVLSCR
jgi:probable HAF family extracellular repeat protein